LQQTDLFETASKYPAGFRYAPEFISRAEERRLIEHLQRLEFKPFEFQGFLRKPPRGLVRLALRFQRGRPDQDRGHAGFPPAAARARGRLRRLGANRVATSPALGISTRRAHRLAQGPLGVRPVVGISLLSACTFRFRRKAGAGWERNSLVLAPRSAYLLHGAARAECEHSIPAVSELRYSITFRNFRYGVGGERGRGKS